MQSRRRLCPVGDLLWSRSIFGSMGSPAGQVARWAPGDRRHGGCLIPSEVFWHPPARRFCTRRNLGRNRVRGKKRNHAVLAEGKIRFCGASVQQTKVQQILCWGPRNRKEQVSRYFNSGPPPPPFFLTFVFIFCTVTLLPLKGQRAQLAF